MFNSNASLQTYLPPHLPLYIMRATHLPTDIKSTRVVNSDQNTQLYDGGVEVMIEVPSACMYKILNNNNNL